MRGSISRGLQMHSVQCLSLLPKCFFPATILEDPLSCTVPQTQSTLNHTTEFYVHVTVPRNKFIFNKTIRHTTRGLSGYRARRRVADSRGPVLVAGLSPNK
jgi:hypothetical protein